MATPTEVLLECMKDLGSEEFEIFLKNLSGACVSEGTLRASKQSQRVNWRIKTEWTQWI